MNTSTQPEKQKDVRKIQFWNRVQLLLVLAVFIAPIAGAFFYKPANFNNYGDLYTPARLVPNLVMHSADDEQTIELDSFRRQWIFLVTASDVCTEACETNIRKMRQLRFMQNNNMKRIRTIVMQTGIPAESAIDLSAKFNPMEVYSVAPDEFIQWTKVLKIEGVPIEAEKDRLYIIDPSGNLMISYPATADPSYIKKDIKRLLKTSQIG